MVLPALVRKKLVHRSKCRRMDVAIRTARRLDAELQEAREQMRLTLADWDERLARTPPGMPARLLESLVPRVS